MAKPMSLADRIRAKQKSNIDPAELESEKRLIKAVTKPRNRASEQVNNSDLDKSPVKPSVSESVNLPVNEPIDYPINPQTNRSINPQTNRSKINKKNTSVSESVSLPVNEPIDYPIPIDPKEPIWILTNIQAKVLLFLINKKSHITQRKEICHFTDLKENTVRHSIRILVKYHFITKPKLYQNGRYRGFKYSINKQLCDQFINERVNALVSVPANLPVRESVIGVTGQSTGTLTDPYNSSSSSLYKETTTKRAREADPEMNFWNENGLTEKQISNWINEFQLGENDLIQKLKWCAWDIKNEKRTPKKTAQDLFYGFMKKSHGSYPKPTDYKSHDEIVIEREQQILDEKKKRIEQLNKIREEQIKADMDLKFGEMMSDPECRLYQDCLNKLPKIHQERFKNPILRKGKAFDNAMRRCLSEALDED